MHKLLRCNPFFFYDRWTSFRYGVFLERNTGSEEQKKEIVRDVASIRRQFVIASQYVYFSSQTAAHRL